MAPLLLQNHLLDPLVVVSPFRIYFIGDFKNSSAKFRGKKFKKGGNPNIVGNFNRLAREIWCSVFTLFSVLARALSQCFENGKNSAIT